MPVNTTTLEKLKILLQLTGTTYDTLLAQLIEVVQEDFCAMTHRSEVPDAAENVVLRMAMVRWTMLKSEGLSNLTMNSITESYCDYDSLTKQINAYRKAVML